VDRPLNLAATRERAFQRAEKWANLAKQVAFETHRQAPRGGVNINKFGEPRSAPGEAPAMETGRLFAILNQQRPAREPDGYSVLVNYTVLEQGYSKGNRVLEPRPLGRITMSVLAASPPPR
jgi:hypothetical protein